MGMMESSLLWLTLLYGACALVLFALTIISWQNRNQPAGLPLAAVAFCGAMWALAYSMELRSMDFGTLWFWRAFKNIFTSLLPVAVATFVLRSTGRHTWPSRRVLLALLIIPALTIIFVLTNPYHQMYWLIPGDGSLEAFERGPWFWLSLMYSYALMFTSIVLGLINISSVWRFYRNQVSLLLAGVLVPIGVNVYVLFGFEPRPPVDLSPLAFGLTVLFLFIVTRGRIIINVVPFAYETLVSQMRDAVILLDGDSRVVQVNKAAERMLGLGEADVLGRLSSEIDHQAFHVLNLQTSAGATFVFEVKLGSQESPQWYDVSLTTLNSNSRDVIGRMTTWRDITERKLNEQRLKFLSTHDQLTGLYNRLYFDTEFDRVGRGRNWPVVVMMIDLDHMKITNDQYGHQMGDEMLRRAAKVLKASFRADDVLARIGGDEFAGLLPGCGEAEAKKLTVRILEMLKQHNSQMGEMPLQLSLGWAVANNEEELQQAMRQADLRMYADKKRGKKP